MVKKECQYCGQGFEPNHPKQKFCSDAHRVAFARKKSGAPGVSEGSTSVTKSGEQSVRVRAKRVNVKKAEPESRVSQPEEKPMSAMERLFKNIK